MKKTLIIILSAIMAVAASEAVSFAAVSSSDAAGIFDKKTKKDIKTITLSANIHCKNCATKVKENIGFEKGVEGLDVSVDKKQVVIKYNPAKTDVNALLAAMKKIGYPATVVAE